MSQSGSKLQRSLKSRHILMMALGGAIGAGIFKGSSSSIDLAGPGVVFPYLVGGLILLVVMRSLALMAVKNDKATTLKDLIEPILGPFAGYVVGWIYWLDWVLVMAAETAAASSFLQFWFPGVPLWTLALIVSIVMTLLNLLQVRIYGETEYWLAAVKIVTLILFVVFGIILIITRFSGHTVAHNLVGHGGLFPHGLAGLVSAMLVVMFSFGGIEMVGMTLGETDGPAKVIPKAARSVIFRILLFYILPIAIILCLVPWNGLGTAQSPFVTVFQQIGIPYVGGVMNFVLLTAVLSAVNSGMYATSRMLYTQALDGQAPGGFAKLSRWHVPVRALMFSTIFLYVGVIVAVFAKGNTFGDLMVIPGYTVMIVWMLLVLARIKQEGIRPTTIVSLLALLAIFIGVIITTPAAGTIVSFIAIAIIVISFLFVKRGQLEA
ncbi:amino acid permease [Alicyclobacillus dauci]|uniref:Amino acid permease n=1 Tax=Alicyclobacillus dauci TaxID=1475485 RepID=A0ABY6Z2U3_9BACL|nr:amino acid permease [Alicyclobacillus dauci]WAH37219.1 amino acid permease [Alicyclobacillus dauci]